MAQRGRRTAAHLRRPADHFGMGRMMTSEVVRALERRALVSRRGVPADSRPRVAVAPDGIALAVMR